MPDLQTTNWLIAVIAASSAIQSVLLIVAGVVGYRFYNQATQRVAELEADVEPLRRQLDAILADVHRITARVSDQTERVDHAITDTIDRVDETAERVKHRVRERVSRAAGIVRGVRAIIASLLTTDGRESRAEAGGRL
jgi:methyl-accepting chemotaxis protein